MTFQKFTQAIKIAIGEYLRLNIQFRTKKTHSIETLKIERAASCYFFPFSIADGVLNQRFRIGNNPCVYGIYIIIWAPNIYYVHGYIYGS